MDYRLYVEKRPEFRVEAESLKRELNQNLGLDIKELRHISVYDLFGFTPELLDQTRFKVFGETATDDVFQDFDLVGKRYIAYECLPGQFDQRASAAEECTKLLQPDADVMIRSGRLLLFDGSVSDEDLAKIAKYVINPVESREKDLNVLRRPEQAAAKPVLTLDGLRDFDHATAEEFCKAKGLAMNADDLMTIVEYFKNEGRDPNETELRILDTYWSDHCRHTTFMSELTDIEVEDSPIADDIRATLEEWKAVRKELGRENKPLCLMDLATIGGRYLAKHGLLDDLEKSEENNACSIYVDVDVDGETERWLLQFKNETHNHPTEIEPFGGASTCLGGAIRDPLSGRAYVYQAMRVTGAGDIYKPVSETMEGKLPQRVISLKAAAGYSSYGNQIGLATTHVREIYHPGYVAKRMEVGAVVGAVRAADVRRERPEAGDVILMLGGRTGRDGIGGATGSSKKHTTSSLEECGAEVQKGNAPEERKIQRLFRRPEVTRLIKKSNDFGAGGVSVAIGELADGLEIYLDRVPTKYSGLNTTEIAISESQERMAVVVEAKDKEEFMRLCHEENLEVTHVADVTDTRRMRMHYGDKVVADLSRDFIDSAGARHFAQAKIAAPELEGIFDRPKLAPKERRFNPFAMREAVEEHLKSPNVVSQRGLIEMFDSTIGRSTVLMPFGGKNQKVETQVSVQKLPVGNHFTNTASMMAWGFNPEISSDSPYHGAAYAVVESIAKIVAAGGDWHRIRFSFQEYFERMSSKESWGKPLAALLGAFKMQKEWGLPAIGGKDSMSGTFGDINVPPTLISFAVAPVDARDVISPEIKDGACGLYMIKHTPLENGMPDVEYLKKAYDAYHKALKKGQIEAAYAPVAGGLCEALAKMSMSDRYGAFVHLEEENDFFKLNYGSIVFQAKSHVKPEELDIPGLVEIGHTSDDHCTYIGNSCIENWELAELNRHPFDSIYPDKVPGTRHQGQGTRDIEDASKRGWGEDSRDREVAPYKGAPVETPVAYLPLFPGTNCDYDMEKAFRTAGAEVRHSVFRNLTAQDVEDSVNEMVANIDACHIMALSGGFSEGDEPDGSGKFIATVLQNEKVKAAIKRLLERDGLILGICNGFQALVKSGLLPDGKIGELTPESPTLFRNDINRHISQIVTTRVASTNSPWLAGFELGENHQVAASHGEGKFVASPELAKRLEETGCIAFQYCTFGECGSPTMTSPDNPNGSTMAIEGIISPDGHILGKMGHSERWEEGLMKNIYGNKKQDIFGNAVRWFRKE